jgi:hypothetical protein
MFNCPTSQSRAYGFHAIARSVLWCPAANLNARTGGIRHHLAAYWKGVCLVAGLNVPMCRGKVSSHLYEVVCRITPECQGSGGG